MIIIIIIIIIIISTRSISITSSDVLGGCSKEVEKNIKELVGDKGESIMRQMQKALTLSSALHIARMFKLSASISTGILDTYFNRILNLVHYRNFIYIP